MILIQTVVFDTLNVIASMIVFGIVAYKMTVKEDKFTWVEMLGMGLTGAGCVLTIGPIATAPSPFDDWSGFLMRAGMATYFVGRLTRHRLNNWMADRASRRRLRERGRL